MADVCREAAPQKPPEYGALWAAMRHWEADRSQADPGGMVVKGRVATAIGPFLGREGARLLLQRVSGDNRNLLSTIEPVLADFLGTRASSELVNHVVDAAMMRA